MCFVINDEDFCRDGFVSLELKRAFVDGFLLTVRDVLGMVLCREFENLKIIFSVFMLSMQSQRIICVSMGTVSLIPLVLYLGLLNISVTSCVALLCGL